MLAFINMLDSGRDQVLISKHVLCVVPGEKRKVSVLLFDVLGISRCRQVFVFALPWCFCV